MNKYDMKILFLLVRSRNNKKGSSALKCRITYKLERKEFSTGKFINPNNWNSKKQLVEPPELDAELINTQLSLIRTKLNQAFLFLQVNEVNFDVHDIYMQYKGKPLKKERGVVEVYDMHSQRIKKLIGIDIQEVTYKKYLESGKHLKDFIKHKYKQKDIKLKALRSNFIDDYVYFLKVEKKFQQSTLNKAVQRFRKVIKFAVAEDYLSKDPFMLYRPKTVRKPIVFLNPEQLKKLEETTFSIVRIQQIKDMFVFCCYTGLGFSEMSNLKKNQFTTEFDGELWININRQKTKKNFKVPLLPKAKAIMELYSSESDYVLPRMSNTKFNVYLKEIANVVGIEFNLTHHIARKTFASTVLLFNDVPMEIVSKLLGHSKLQTTQDHYGKVVESRIAKEIKRIKGSS
ncbi:site-specific integrase [Pontimicrobium aquaticum]|uniref:Site-specific integrase n=1 Tax=Pontimicrobium aquaticum TaxID=2565367 RepID=A0A4U0F117_9FLAO|nr:site-specific integrase [Pontimicrobium aquaticum]TJY37940.1 site-specific integrase [Pontimicrobium aquaticum]